MSRASLVNWLNLQVSLYKMSQKSRVLYTEDEVEYCAMLSSYTDGIHVSSPKKLARLLDYPITVEQFPDNDYTYKVSFIYDGIKFFGLYTEREFENE